jgi:hypothetical protein
VYRHRFSFANFLVSGRGNIFLFYSVQSVDFLLYRVQHLTLPILSCQYCLCGLWEGSLTMVVGFHVALDSVNMVCAAAHILCGRVRVKQVDHICAARVS